MPPTRNQLRAARAAQFVNAVNTDPGKRYNTLVNKLPAMILASGLLQTLAFLRSKGKANSNSAEMILENQIKNHLSFDPKKDIIDELAKMDSFQYARAQDEVLRCLGWHRRFSRARFGDPEDHE